MIKQLYKLHKLLVLHCNHTALIATEIALPFWIPHKSHRWMIAPLFQHLLKSLSYQQHLPVHVRKAPFGAALALCRVFFQRVGGGNAENLLERRIMRPFRGWRVTLKNTCQDKHMIIMIRETIQAVRVR